MKKFILPLIVAVALCGVAQAAQKIATVDMAAIMTEYQKAVDLKTRLEGDAKLAQSSRDEKVQKLQTLRTELETLAKQAQDPILNEQGKKDATAKAQAKFNECQQAENEFKQQMQTTMAALQSREQANIKQLIEDVKLVVTEIAKEKGYDIVMPAASLLYANPELNITGETVKRLNTAYTAAK